MINFMCILHNKKLKRKKIAQIETYLDCPNGSLQENTEIHHLR